MSRHLFAAGKLSGRGSLHNPDLTPVAPPSAGTGESSTRPCNNGYGPHEGPMTRTDIYDAYQDAEIKWVGFGECERCGSTIHKSQLRSEVA